MRIGGADEIKSKPKPSGGQNGFMAGLDELENLSWYYYHMFYFIQ